MRRTRSQNKETEKTKNKVCSVGGCRIDDASSSSRKKQNIGSGHLWLCITVSRVEFAGNPTKEITERKSYFSRGPFLGYFCSNSKWWPNGFSTWCPIIESIEFRFKCLSSEMEMNTCNRNAIATTLTSSVAHSIIVILLRKCDGFRNFASAYRNTRATLINTIAVFRCRV